MGWIRAISGKRTKQPLIVVDRSSSTSSVSQAARPDEFFFTDLIDVPTSTLETSNTITVSGLTSTVTASISGAASSQMQRNGGVWSAGPLVAQSGDTFAVRHISSDTALTTISTTLDIGGVSDTFSSTTAITAGSSAGQPAGLLLAITKAS